MANGGDDRGEVGSTDTCSCPGIGVEASGCASPLVAAIEHVVHRELQRQPAVVIILGEGGAGKTSALEQVATSVSTHGLALVTLRCSPDRTEAPFHAAVELIHRLRSVDDDRPIAFTPGMEAVASAGWSIAQGFRNIFAGCPGCLIIDDVDHMDPMSRESLVLALALLGDESAPLTVIAAGRRDPDWHGSVIVTLEPLAEAHLVDVLTGRGVADEPARTCARAARGLPGVAIALADQLTPGQRSGDQVLPAMLRPPKTFIEQQIGVLETLPPGMQRALVVVAADDQGHIGVILTALRSLGEDDGLLELAESAGLVEIDGPFVRFVDPWLRPAAYYLVAPASRRAAHRALADAYRAPNQAVARAWQIAAGEIGHSDLVAATLGRVAIEVAQESGVVIAKAIFRRAIEFAETAAARERLLLAAVEAAVDDLELVIAREFVAGLEPTSDRTALAIAETLELCGLPVQLPLRSGVTSGPWAHRRSERLMQDSAARSGTTTLMPTATTVAARVRGQLAHAQMCRHAGHLGDARGALLDAESLLTPSCLELRSLANVLHADLDHLVGRFDECEQRLELVGWPTNVWTRGAADLIALRVRASRECPETPPWASKLWVDVAVDELASVRSRIARACRLRDADGLKEIADHAARAGLPIEAFEARLAGLEACVSSGRSIDATDFRELTYRGWQLGVHAWDRRMSTLSSMATDRPEHDVSCLTQAELRVANAVGSGMTNREAATALYLSVKTIDFHLQQIYRKLELRSRTELAVVLADNRPSRFAAVAQ